MDRIPERMRQAKRRHQETMMTANDPPVALPLNLHDYEAVARTLLPPMIFDFVAWGTGDKATVRGNRAAFERWRLLPRVLQGVREASTATSVLGQAIALPVLIAPSSLHRLCHDAGVRATARAAKGAGTIYTMSTPASIVLEDVAPAAGPWWFQLYVFRDRGLTRDLVDRAAAAGASALVVTVDMPALGRREADERHRFTLPPGVTMPNVQLPAPRPAAEAGESAKWTTAAPAVEAALTWVDLDWLASLSPLPVIPRGLLRPADAAAAVAHGAPAVIVSNHGGRQLDGAVATLDALPAVVESVAGRAEVLVDGGIRRGTDVLKALALGARAVLVGRPVLWGLAVDGEAGVRHVLELLRAELTLDLLLCGLANPAGVNRSLIVPAGVALTR